MKRFILLLIITILLCITGCSELTLIPEDTSFRQQYRLNEPSLEEIYDSSLQWANENLAQTSEDITLHKPQEGKISGKGYIKVFNVVSPSKVRFDFSIEIQQDAVYMVFDNFEMASGDFKQYARLMEWEYSHIQDDLEELALGYGEAIGSEVVKNR